MPHLITPSAGRHPKVVIILNYDQAVCCADLQRRAAVLVWMVLHYEWHVDTHQRGLLAIDPDADKQACMRVCCMHMHAVLQ
jgi:hypothetical protein